MARLLASDDVDEQIEILAVMRQGGFRPPTRGQGGQRRFVPRSGPPRTGPAARFGAPPPRDRKDITCINCKRKGHMASECRQQKVEVKDRKCFICNKTGHIAKDCKEKPAPLKAIVDAGCGQQRQATVMCVQLAPPRPGQLVDHILKVEPRRSNGNRFQPLTLGNASFWESVAPDVSETCAPPTAMLASDFPSLSAHSARQS